MPGARGLVCRELTDLFAGSARTLACMNAQAFKGVYFHSDTKQKPNGFERALPIRNPQSQIPNPVGTPPG